MGINAGFKRVERDVNRARSRNEPLDLVMGMIGHYSRVNGDGQSAAVTYYTFLAFFPVVALAFFVVGVVANVWPDARDGLTGIINDAMPGLIGNDKGQVSLSVFQDNAATAGVVALVGFAYTGVGVVGSMRTALLNLFATPREERPNMWIGKARDLIALAVGGIVLLAVISLTTLINRYSEELTQWVGLDRDSLWYRAAVFAVGAAVAVTVLAGALLALYDWLARPKIARRALREGALFAAVGFLVLWLIADRLIAYTHGKPAFTVLGFSLVLLVMINYFTRVVMYGAAWAVVRAKNLTRREHATPAQGESEA